MNRGRPPKNPKDKLSAHVSLRLPATVDAFYRSFPKPAETMRQVLTAVAMKTIRAEKEDEEDDT